MPQAARPAAGRSRAEGVFGQLRRRILDGDLGPGSSLPSERVLCELLGVNRGAVREGLKRLQQAGLVEIRHGGATRVMDYRDSGGLELLTALLTDTGGALQPEVARAIVEMRSTLAPAVAAKAAERGGKELRDALENRLTAIERSDGLPQRQAAILQFWSLLVEHCGNLAYRLAFNSMRRTYAAIQDQLTGIMADEFNDLDNLRGIAAAVRAGDPDSAHRHAAAHVAIGEHALAALFDRLQTQTEGGRS